jgi:hypothetical protein
MKEDDYQDPWEDPLFLVIASACGSVLLTGLILLGWPIVAWLITVLW